jgi:hypothetical protein
MRRLTAFFDSARSNMDAKFSGGFEFMPKGRSFAGVDKLKTF